MKTEKKKAGFSLIEVMVAALLLAVLALGGGAVLHRTGGDIQVMGNKRVALEWARTELERLRATDYFKLREQTPSQSKVVQVNGVSLTVTSLISGYASGGVLYDSTGGAKDNEYLVINVRVQYGRSTDEVVVLDAVKVFEP